MDSLQESVRQTRQKALADAKAEITEAECQYRVKVAAYLEAHPEEPYEKVADHFRMSRSFVAAVAKKFNVARPKGRPKKVK